MLCKEKKSFGIPIKRKKRKKEKKERKKEDALQKRSFSFSFGQKILRRRKKKKSTFVFTKDNLIMKKKRPFLFGLFFALDN